MCVDDEQHALDLLKLYCEKSQDVNLVASTTDPWSAKEMLEETDIDVLFLDIQMPGITGLQFLDLIDPDFAVVLTSAYSEYALDGYKYNVIDYLLKPIAFNRFQEAINRVKTRTTIQHLDAQTEQSFLNLRGDTKGTFFRIEIDHIRYIEALRNHVIVHHDKGKSITLMSIGEIEKLLTNKCLRIHRSYIVNPQRVNRVEGQSVFIEEVNLPIGKTYKEAAYHSLGLR
jgi:DNA-binding LytR/AlgR family response regulator